MDFVFFSLPCLENEYDSQSEDIQEEEEGEEGFSNPPSQNEVPNMEGVDPFHVLDNKHQDGSEFGDPVGRSI